MRKTDVIDKSCSQFIIAKLLKKTRGENSWGKNDVDCIYCHAHNIQFPKWSVFWIPGAKKEMGGNGFLLTCSCITFMPKKENIFLIGKVKIQMTFLPLRFMAILDQN